MSRLLVFVNTTIMWIAAFLVVLGVATDNWSGAALFAAVAAVCLTIRKVHASKEEWPTRVRSQAQTQGTDAHDEERQRLQRERALNDEFEQHLRREPFRNFPDSFL